MVLWFASVAPAQCPILRRNFRLIMKKVRIRQSHALLRKKSMSRTGYRMALISTRPLSLPSAGAFPLPVHLKLGKLLITRRIPMGSIAILYSNPLHPASVVSSARGFLGLLLRNGYLRNTIGRLPTKKSRQLWRNLWMMPARKHSSGPMRIPLPDGE